MEVESVLIETKVMHPGLICLGRITSGNGEKTYIALRPRT